MFNLKRKSLIIAIITFISVLVFSQVSLMFYKNNKDDLVETTKAADLTITSADDLRSFIADVRGGNDYTGKTVVLGASFSVGEIEPIGYINAYMSNETNRGFNGTFNGQGQTLSNITVCGAAYYYFQMTGGGGHYSRDYTCTYKVRSALFGALGSKASICNVFISNITYKAINIDTPQHSGISITYDITRSAPAAIYTDCSSGASFTNIRVDNPSGFNSGFGNGDAVVNDCELRNSKGKGFGVKCVNSVFKQESGYGCAKPFEEGSSGCLSSSGEMSSSCSSESGQTGTVWYYGGAGYNDGYSTLRVFMKDWRTIKFEPGTGGNVSPGSIEIPSDYALSNLSDYGGTESVNILEQNIRVTPDSGYKVVSWKRSSITYTITFSQKTCGLSFLIGNINQDSSSMQVSKTGDTYYDTYEGALVRVSVDAYAWDMRYKSISYTFTAVTEDGDSFIETETTVTYTVKSNLYYLYLNDNKYSTNFYAEQGSSNNIRIMSKLKSYNITIG